MSRKGEAETPRAYRPVAVSTIKARDAKKTRARKMIGGNVAASLEALREAWGANEVAIDTITSFNRHPGTNR